MEVMSHIKRFDHVGITVADLDSVTAFFVDLGLEVEGRTFVEASSSTRSSASRTRGPRSSCSRRPGG
jgi:catechol 2,3-dioxygenase-like lactoylglutathione lyase family enzyme